MEKWKDIVGYEGHYQVSDAGRVRSLDRFTSRSYKGKILRPGAHSAGYLVVNLRKNKKTLQKYVHRLAAESFLGTSSLFVNHKDLNKKNNLVSNLEYVTNTDNLLRAFKSGVKVGKTILNAEQRKNIRELRKQGLKLKELALKFGVSETAISEVARGTTWSWE